MADQTGSVDTESLAALFARLIDDGANLFRAELNLYRQSAMRRVARAKLPVILVVAGALLAQSAITTMLVGCAFGLARWIGPVGGGIAAGVGGLVVSGLLIQAAVRRFMAVFEDANEKDASATAERVVEETIA